MDWKNKFSSWTDMLEDSTNNLRLRYRDDDTPETINKRKRILKDLYCVARLEEECSADVKGRTLFQLTCVCYS